MPNHDLFDSIYNAAKHATSKDDLKEKLDNLEKSRSDFFINEQQFDKTTGIIFTPASKLAYDLAKDSENYKNVEWLCSLGNEKTFQNAALGFAMAGEHTIVREYYSKHKVDPSYIALGYLLGGYKEEIWLPYAQLSTMLPEEIAARAYAFLGDEASLDKCYMKLRENPNKVDINALTATICEAASSGWHYELASKYSGDNFNFAFVKGVAMRGDHEYVDNKLSTVSNLGAIIEGYAEGGFHNKVKALCKQHYQYRPTIDATRAYQRLGNNNKAKEFDIDLLLESYFEKRTAIKEGGVTKQYTGLDLPFFRFFQKSYDEKTAAIKNLRIALNHLQLGDEAPLPDNFDLMKHLSTLRNGNLGKNLRKFIREGMADGLVGAKVRTVTAFVTTLHTKINPQPKQQSSNTM